MLGPTPLTYSHTLFHAGRPQQFAYGFGAVKLISELPAQGRSHTCSTAQTVSWTALSGWQVIHIIICKAGSAEWGSCHGMWGHGFSAHVSKALLSFSLPHRPTEIQEPYWHSLWRRSSWFSFQSTSKIPSSSWLMASPRSMPKSCSEACDVSTFPGVEREVYF